MAEEVTNVGVDSATPEMKNTAQHLKRAVVIGVVSGLVGGFITAVWIAGSGPTNAMIATTLSVMGASATIGGLMGANFAPE